LTSEVDGIRKKLNEKGINPNDDEGFKAAMDVLAEAKDERTAAKDELTAAKGELATAEDKLAAATVERNKAAQALQKQQISL